MKFIDLVGKRFGHLLVIKDGRNRNEHGCLMATVRCDCGKEKTIKRFLLQSQNPPQACRAWCFPTEKQKTYSIRLGASKLPGQLAEQRMCFRQYVGNAKRRGHGFSLTFDEFVNTVVKPCHYCGTSLGCCQKKTKRKKSSLHPELLHSEGYVGWFYTGLDRINSEQGYTKNNIVPCCWKCNQAKSNSTVSDFIQHAFSIVEHQSEEISIM